MQITKNTVARFEYTLTDDKGTVIDSSEGQEPLAYVHGLGNIIPGLEEEMEGKTTGDAFKVRVPAAKGYGDRDDNMVHDVPIEELPKDVKVEVGMQFRSLRRSSAVRLGASEPRPLKRVPLQGS